jgi:AAHS family 4-hydroxybenzoate transporter-like MFS transporter
MSPARRIVALLLLAGVFFIDGYDINSMALAVPRLEEPLGLAPERFGWVLSAILVGLGTGSALIAPLGDRLGRRPLIVFGCLVAGCAALGTAAADTLTGFFVWRFLTGIGLGACLPNCSALSAELAPAGKRASLMVLVSVGISGGALIAGMTAPELVAIGGWHALFVAPGLFAAALALALWFVLPAGPPESLSGEAPAAGAPARAAKAPQLELLRSPWLFPFAIFAIVLTFNSANLYLLSQWMPSILPHAGFTVDQAARVSGLTQGAGIAVGLLLSWLLDNWKPGRTMVSAYALVTLALLAMGLAVVAGPAWWTVLLLLAMGGVSGGAMAIPALTAFLFPSRLLSSAIGMGVLIARVGAIAAPLIGGEMLKAGATPGHVLLAAAVPAAICALVCLALPAALAVRKRIEAA